MKKRLILVIIIIYNISFAQVPHAIRKVVQVKPQETFYLNSNLTDSTRKKRLYFIIQLPPHTVEWYYSFTTEKGLSQKHLPLNLTNQLRKIVDSGDINSPIITPTGSGSCDLYLMDEKNADSFYYQVDLKGRQFYYFTTGSRENHSNGLIKITGGEDATFYMAFRNPSLINDVTISFEVAAVTEETIINENEWPKEKKDSLYKTFYQNLLRQQFGDSITNGIANCLVNSITTLHTPKAYNEMLPQAKMEMLEKLYAECTERYMPPKTPTQEKAINYGNLGWKAFEGGDLEKCIEYSKKALSFDNAIGWVKANLGLCYLIKGEESTAVEYYMDALEDIKMVKIKNQLRLFLSGAVEDINKEIKKRGTLKGANSIKALFEDELQKL